MYTHILVELVEINPWEMDQTVICKNKLLKYWQYYFSLMNTKLLMTFLILLYDCNSYLHFSASSDVHAAMFCLSCLSLLCDAFLSSIVQPYFWNPLFNLTIKSQSQKEEKKRKIKCYVKRGNNESLI